MKEEGIKRLHVWLALVISFFFTNCVAIVVTGLVLGEPTLLITGSERLRQAEAKSIEMEQRAREAEGKLWHIQNPGRGE